MEVEVVTEVFHVPHFQMYILSLDITAEVACLHFMVLGSMDYWASTWFLASSQTTNRAPGCSRAMDLYRVLKYSWYHRHQHGFRHTACTLALHSVAVWATDVNINQATARLWTQTWSSTTAWTQTSLWPWMAAKVTQIIMGSGGSTAPKRQHVSWQ